MTETTARKTKRISISFEPNGEGTMKLHGGSQYPCLGEPGRMYKTDLTVQGIEGVDKFKNKFSHEYQVDMPWAILIMGQVGIYIHEMPDNLADNNGPTAGCIHLAGPAKSGEKGNAEKVWHWVDGRTRITITYPW